MESFNKNDSGSSNTSDGHPLSAAQHGIWLDLQLNPNDTAYSLCDYICIDGEIDPVRLADAIRYIVKRCDSFHLRFSGDAIRPRQTFSAPESIDVPFLDFSDASVPKESALLWIKNDLGRAFKLSGEPLYRNTIIKTSRDSFYWYRNYHHLVADGFSFVLLGRWVAYVYKQLASGHTTQQLDATVKIESYRAYLDSESEYRSTPQFILDREFWKSTYSGIPEQVSLSVRQSRLRAQRAVCVNEVFLSTELQNKLYKLAERLQIDLGQMFIGLIALYVQRSTGAQDIPLCIPIHGRERGPTLEMTGMCTNSLPIRFRIDPQRSIDSLLKDAAAMITESLTHRRYRMEHIQEDIGVHRIEETPFRIQANVLRTRDQGKTGEKPATAETLSTGWIRDLQVMIIESHASTRHFRVVASFNPALYELWEIELHQRYLQRLMEGASADSSTGLRDLQLMNCAEMETLLSQWSHKERISSKHAHFQLLFEEQCRLRGDNIAIEHNDDSINYRELDRRATDLARRLSLAGARSELMVGVCLERSIDLIVAILAIWKSGAAFVPLEPDLPPARLKFMAQDADVQILVTHSDFELIVPDDLLHTIFMDTIDNATESLCTEQPLPEPDSHNLAYVIYTSGSTGHPKGVLVQHDGVCNLALAQIDGFGITPVNRVLQYARLGFDAAISEIVITLASGATLVMADKFDLLPGNLQETLADNRIDVVTLPPSILPSMRDAQLPYLHTLIVAGEPCPVEVARSWAKHCRVINAYGPTETTVCATFGEFDDGEVVSIGRPLANTSVYILNEHMFPTPCGIVGEIFVGGIGVARGYLNRIDLTRECFMDDTFSRQPGARMYRTGDLGRYRPDGSIEFLGRKDRQLKVRGFRVEANEVELALLELPNVVECVVELREFMNRDQLVAYVVTPDKPDSMSGPSLRALIRKILPEYMLPAVFMFLPALPRTHSGKIDRRALPSPGNREFARTGRSPKTPTERELAKIWFAVLGIDDVRLDDNFFDLGGDSISALNVVAMSNESFSIELQPQILYETENFEALATKIEVLIHKP